MITFTTSGSDEDFNGIIALQKENLPAKLTADEMLEQGFVTVVHSMEDLRKMKGYERNLIMKDGDKIAGYLLAMTKNSQSDIPVLIPMFEVFDKILYCGKLVTYYKFMVVGQVCIDKNYRGKGLLDKSYTAYKNLYKNKYDFAITEIATANHRSLNAHKRIGFKEVHQFTDINKIEWSIVIWNWQ